MKNSPQLCTYTALLAGAFLLSGCGGGSEALVSTTATDSAVVFVGNGQVARTIVGGTGLPNASVGMDGDYFLNIEAGRLFGPKFAGVWPVASLSLVGPVGLPGGTGATGAAGAVGAMGATGATGATGAAGAAGAMGATGAIGATGPVGPSGSGSSGVALYSGSVVPSNALGRDGDFYLNFTENTMVGPKAGGAWPNTGVSVVGATGPAGATGAAGHSLLGGAGTPNDAVGSNGDYYINTSNSSLVGPKSAGIWPALGISLVGATGAAGAPGAPGVAGTNGAPGTPGVNGGVGPAGTSILSGAGTPAGTLGNVGDLYFDSTARTLTGPKTGAGWPVLGTALNGANGTNGTHGRTIFNAAVDPAPGDGMNGDFFINTASSRLFGPKAGGAWPPGVSLLGANGAAGTNGSTILNGTANPSAGTGANGDFFINTASSQLFGPKVAGTWPAGVSLVGPAGANGKTILNGSSDPVNATGTNGDFFINITTSTLFGPKNAGAWPTGVSLVGPAAGVVAPEIFACGAGVPTVVTPASNATRTLFCNFDGNNPRISGTRVSLVLPAASTYASGTVITFRTTGTIFPSGSPEIKGVPLQFFFRSASSTYTGYATTASTDRNKVDTTNFIELVNREGALLSVMAVGVDWYQVSP